MLQLIALVTTLAIEGCGMAVLAWLLPGWRGQWLRAVLLALGLNLVSHTIFWYTLPHVTLPYAVAVPVAELVVALGEGAVYATTVARPRWTGWLVSLALNWASWVLGSYVWRLV
ncbi:MAG: hypothetical protein IPK16_05975 [Anaerolineales bacterium]|nr:hypothetical protein [Anaerolineales bacterium]